MNIEDMVDANLAGLEAVTTPSLPDVADWTRFNNVHWAVGPNLLRAHVHR